MVRSMVVVAMEATTATMAIHPSSSPSAHSSAEASFAEVASPSSMTAAATGNLRGIVTALVSPLRHHLSDVGKVHPDPICISSQRETSHLVHSCCSSVDALVLDCRPPILHLVADL